MKPRKGYLVGGLVIALAFGALLFNGLKSMSSYYYEVSELNASILSVSQFVSWAQDLGNKQVTVTGNASDISADTSGSKQASFTLSDGSERISVSYAGTAPGFLSSGATVVARGTAAGEGLAATWLGASDKSVKVRGMVADAPINWDIATRQTSFTITEYYTVSAYKEWQSNLGDKQVKVLGKVSGPVERDAQGSLTRFAITDGKEDLAVSYSGAAPGSLVAGSEVVVVGKAGADGSLNGTGLGTREGLELTVVYNGPVPDNFGVGVEVVVDGTKGVDGAFRASQLTTKCASKYVPAAAPQGS